MAIDPKRGRRQLCLVLVFLLGSISLALLTVAYATENWVEASPVRNVSWEVSNTLKNVSNSRLTGSIRLGLFRGLKTLDNGLGPRVTIIDVYTEVLQRQASSASTIPAPVWTALVILGVFSGAWGVVSCGFALLNISRRPVLGLSGPGGLYVWNGAQLLCQFAAAIVFGAAFSTSLSSSVLSREDTAELKWTSNGLAWLGFSYWLLVACCFCSTVNLLLLLLLANARLGPCCLPASERRGRGEVDLSIVY
ncbi:hypothetical protein BOX15_Mlig034120g1 [Macrostomum lignano]|uniref:Uncharacterized protein n=1 Tax=Macrostomum lignano TaxID=282301 RepID=A0A267E464_9PLAT|nr:hypothetical protein BOX15_Mlig034120g1 [Macrostomum lignano]